MMTHTHCWQSRRPPSIAAWTRTSSAPAREQSAKPQRSEAGAGSQYVPRQSRPARPLLQPVVQVHAPHRGGGRPCPRKARGTAASGPPPVGCGRHLPAWQGVADACTGAAHANSRHTPRSASSEKITATDTVQTQQTTERDRLGGCASSAPVEEKLDWPKT
jgi:hypothetical protein